MMASLWVRSSVPLPMSDLEYDVLAGSYSSGYAAALSAVFHTLVRVLSRRHEGHFYHALAEGGPGCVTEGAPGSSRWESNALPLLHRHFDELRRLAAGSHLDAGELPRLFQQNVFLHHLMLLPIRVRIDCLVADLGSRLASRPEERRAVALDVLDVATSRDFPLPTYLEQLVSEETGAAPSEGAVPLRSVAPDGDGYGIAVPGWLDDETYVVRYRRLLLRLGVTSAALQDRALRSATRAADALTRLRQLSERVSLWREVEGLTAIAEQARITELHGPLMHVEYMHRIRGVVLAWGARLAAEDRLDAPEHIFHVRLHELGGDAWDLREVKERQARYDEQVAAPPPPPQVAWPLKRGQPLSETAQRRLSVLGEVSAEQPRRNGGGWLGIPAARGSASGQLVCLRRQADIDRLGPGDIAVTPDGGAAWGWLAFAGIPLVVTHGSRLGHAATLARAAGTACIVATTDPARVVPYGATVSMSGETGRMEW